MIASIIFCTFLFLYDIILHAIIIIPIKNICQIEQTRHRSVHGFLVNLFSALITYKYFPKKPSLKITKNEINNMELLAC